ncbi:MAG: DUF2079 domain-containing protein [Candidatus Levyibacteriota bacterium]
MKLSPFSRYYNTLKFLFSWPLAALAFVFLLYTLSKQNISFSRVFSHVSFSFLFFSVACYFFYFLIRSIIWYILLCNKNITIPRERATYIWSISELKRYIPGNFWSFLGKGILLSAHGAKKKEIFHLLLIEAEFFAAGCVLASIPALPLLNQYVFYNNPLSSILMFLLEAGGVLMGSIFLFHSWFLTKVPAPFAKRLRPLLPGFTAVQTLQLLFLTICYLSLFGLGTFFAVLSVTFLTPFMLLAFISFFIFSLFFGYITILTPMGLGVREGMMSVGLAPFLGVGVAVFASILARILQVAGEVLFVCFVVLWYRSKTIQRVIFMVQEYGTELFLGVMVSLFTLYYTIAGFLRYDNFFTGRFDLGNMDQTVWNTLHGNVFQFTDPNGTKVISRLAFHADVILVFFAPLYAFWSDPRVLIFLQAFTVAMGAVFIFLIAKSVLKKPLLALAVSCAYLLNPGLSYSVLYDFHPVVLATGFLLAAYYFLLKKKRFLFFLFIVLSALTKEEVWIVAAFLGIRLAMDGIEWKKKSLHITRLGVAVTGILTFFISLGMFYVLVSHVIPGQRGDVHFALSYFSHLGSSPGEIFLSLFIAPQKWVQLLASPARINYILEIMSPVAFLPLFAIPSLIFAIPDLAINVLSNNGQLHEIYYQYTATITPFIFTSAVYGIKIAQKRIRLLNDTVLIAVLLGSSLFSAYVLGPLPGSLHPNIDMFTRQLSNRKEISQFLMTIDEKYSVAASNNVGSHLSQREKIYTIPNGLDEADVIVFLLNDTYAQPSLPAQKQMVENLRKNPSYKILYETGDFIAFSKI